MAEKNNATCSICGNEYYVCLSCRDSVKLAPWKIHCDTSEHYKIYQIIHGLSTNVFTKEEAKARLKNVDLKDLNTFRPHIKKIIKDLLKEPVAKVIEPSAEMVEENTVVDGVDTIVKATNSRKRNYKAEVEQ